MWRLFFDEMYDELVWKKNSRWLRENEDNFDFKIVLPGIKKEEVDVYIQNHQLIVETSKHYFSTTLPDKADPDNIKAALDLGLLTVTIGKRDLPKKAIAIT